MATQPYNENACSQPQAALYTRQVRHPSWWVLGPIVALPPLLAFVLLLFYGKQFSDSFSQKQDVWGQFGDFVGGVLNPFIAWVSMIIIAVTLRYTGKAIQVSAEAVEAARDQVNLAQEQFLLEVNEQKNRRSKEKQAEREQRTLQLHQTWISPEMHVLRTEVWEFLSTKVREQYRFTAESNLADSQSFESQRNSDEPRESDVKADASPVFIGGYRVSPEIDQRRLYYSIGSISHFMADANAMLNASLLDRDLFWNLLGRSLVQWCDLYHRLDFRINERDESNESLNENAWHRDSVQGLSNELNRIKIASAITEQLKRRDYI
jgi:hypothetical protein